MLTTVEELKNLIYETPSMATGELTFQVGSVLEPLLVAGILFCTKALKTIIPPT